MTGRRSDLYEAILERIRNLFQWNPTEATCDYEYALLRAVRVVFPGINQNGCWFHYCQVNE
jgi:hypothetical protein